MVVVVVVDRSSRSSCSGSMRAELVLGASLVLVRVVVLVRVRGLGLITRFHVVDAGMAPVSEAVKVGLCTAPPTHLTYIQCTTPYPYGVTLPGARQRPFPARAPAEELPVCQDATFSNTWLDRSLAASIVPLVDWSNLCTVLPSYSRPETCQCERMVGTCTRKQGCVPRTGVTGRSPPRAQSTVGVGAPQSQREIGSGWIVANAQWSNCWGKMDRVTPRTVATAT